MRNLRMILAGSSAAIAILPVAALAQDSPATTVPSARASVIPSSEIIVTAQRREERAQDVPIAITAFSGEQLDQRNVKQPQDLYGSVPSLVVGNQGQAVRDVQSYSIRGQSTGFLSSPAVAIYLAEVPLPASVNFNLQGSPGMFLDLENVQVLEGPQGTLFGRNTTGGAVLLVPQKPTNKFEGYVEGTVGNYDLRAVEGAINIPIIDDVLMVRAAAAYRDRDGYTRDLVWNKSRDDIHYYTGRLGILFRPTERLENYLMAYVTNSDNNGAGHIHRGWNYNLLRAVGFCSDTAPVPGLGVSCDVYRRQTEIADQNGPRRTRNAVDEFAKIKNWGITNTTSFELMDELTLRNIVSYQKLKDKFTVDQDGTPIQQYDTFILNNRFPNFPIPGLAEFGIPITPGNVYVNGDPSFDLPTDNIKQFTEEFQIQGNMLDKHLTFTVGGFYYSAKPDGLWGRHNLNFCPALFTGLCGLGSAYSGITNKSKALYAQGTFDFGAVTPALENLRLTAGYRYTWDTVSGFSSSWRPNAVAPGTVICSGTGAIAPNAAALDDCRFDATLKSKAPTWTVGLDYKPIQNLMVYGKISRGYKAGGLNTFAVQPETQTFDPEKLTSYEAGFKSDWLVGSMPVRFNANYYYSDYKNVQRPAGDFNPTTGAQGAQILGATARIQGFSADASIRPIKAIEIGGSVSYTDAKYKTFEQVVLSPAGQIACNSTVVGGAVVPVPRGSVADYSCNKFQFVTPWIVNANATVNIPIPEALGALSLFVNYSHVSSQNTSPLSPAAIGGVPVEPGVLIEGYGLLNASIDWRNIGGRGLDASLFVTNLTNKLYRVSNSGVFQSLGVWSELYGEPRMYGLRLRYRFGS
jgi:iron complex outermembrane receptor protein